MIVDNRPGANGVIGMRAVAKAAPDGLTLLFANSSTTSINPALYANVGYDVRKDFAPIGMIAQLGIGVIANPSFAARTLGDLIALAKREPGKLSIGTSPAGSGSHLSAELFKATAGVDVTLVPYKGAAALTNDLLGGHIPLVFSVLPPALGNIQSGKLRLIAVTTPQRMSLFPDVPTVAEAGLAGFEATTWHGVVVPAGVAGAVVQKLNQDINSALKEKDLGERLVGLGAEIQTGTPRDFADYIAREIPKWTKVVKDSGARAD